MERTKLKDRILPKYTRGEEIFNMTSHITGAAFGLIALVICVAVSSYHRDAYAVISSIIYGISIIVLYTMSSIYHGLGSQTNAKKVFQILDHCSIFLLIAGSYTPFCLVMFREYDAVTGWTIFGVIWTMAIIGIILNSIDIKKYKKISMICYLAMGWCIILKANLLPVLLEKAGLILLIAGGIAYSLGAILYGLGKKKKYIHSVFHLFVVLGTILQFLCIVLYVI
ncbi:MAG: hemolysin III family protein [Clostridia bacterium]|nr:hemolysin III family protein [Clostridia bacterium]